MASVTLSKVRKTYSNGMEAVHGLDLEVNDGEFLVLVGPSGCGKTTVLRMLAGLEKVTSGEIRIGDTLVNDLQPKDRDIAMVFQNYALYPHMTVAGNIGFALKVAGVPKAEIERKVKDTAQILGLTEWLDRKPSQLSGGQRQRVAMGRAVVREPTVFLMDEPLSNLDARLRVQMRAEVSRIQAQLGISAVYVTHDQVEAMTMGHRVAVMNSGNLAQCETPYALYNEPQNMFVAQFIGSPSMNLFVATLAPDLATVALGTQQLSLGHETVQRLPGIKAYAGKDVVIGLRPEHLKLTAEDGPGERLAADVDLAEQLGSEQLLHFRIDARRASAGGVEEPDEQGLHLSGAGVARIDPEADVLGGRRVGLKVDLTRAHFFDPATELAIR